MTQSRKKFDSSCYIGGFQITFDEKIASIPYVPIQGTIIGDMFRSDLLGELYKHVISLFLRFDNPFSEKKSDYEKIGQIYGRILEEIKNSQESAVIEGKEHSYRIKIGEYEVVPYYCKRCNRVHRRGRVYFSHIDYADKSFPPLEIIPMRSIFPYSYKIVEIKEIFVDNWYVFHDLKVGMPLKFVFEETHESDGEKVAIYHGETKIGYVPHYFVEFVKKYLKNSMEPIRFYFFRYKNVGREALLFEMGYDHAHSPPVKEAVDCRCLLFPYDEDRYYYSRLHEFAYIPLYLALDSSGMFKDAFYQFLMENKFRIRWDYIKLVFTARAEDDLLNAYEYEIFQDEYYAQLDNDDYMDDNGDDGEYEDDDGDDIFDYLEEDDLHYEYELNESGQYVLMRDVRLIPCLIYGILFYFDSDKFREQLYHILDLSKLLKGFQKRYLYTPIKALFILKPGMIDGIIESYRKDFPEFTEMLGELRDEIFGIKIYESENEVFNILL